MGITLSSQHSFLYFIRVKEKERRRRREKKKPRINSTGRFFHNGSEGERPRERDEEPERQNAILNTSCAVAHLFAAVKSPAGEGRGNKNVSLQLCEEHQFTPVSRARTLNARRVPLPLHRGCASASAWQHPGHIYHSFLTSLHNFHRVAVSYPVRLFRFLPLFTIMLTSRSCGA